MERLQHLFSNFILLASALAPFAPRAYALAPARYKAIPMTDPHLYVTPENWVYLNFTHETKTVEDEEGNTTEVDTPDELITRPATSHNQKVMRKQFKKTAILSSNNPGAYFKIGFTGTTFGIVLDTSLTTEEDDELPKIGYRVDHGEMKYVLVSEVGPRVIVPLVDHLQGNVDHEIRVSIDALGKPDRWTGPLDQVKVLGLVLDRGEKTFSPTLEQKKIVVYGDSITEGAALLARPNYIYNKQWSSSWDSLFADKIGAEVSTIAFAAQGYHSPAQGNVPSLNDSFTLIREGVAREFSDPDDVFVLQGTNHGATTDEVVFLMQNLRQRYPTSKLIFMIPFGQFAHEHIREAYDQEQTHDQDLYLIDLGEEGAKIVANNSEDAIHPNKNGHQLLADLIYQKFKEIEATWPPAPATPPAPQPHGLILWVKNLFH